jgi:hypothetical protein
VTLIENTSMEHTDRAFNGRVYTEWKIGHVYFAEKAAHPDVIKVGWSQNPWYRTRSLGSGHGKIRLFATIEIVRGSILWGTGYDSLEQRVHRHMERHRVCPFSWSRKSTGEWYMIERSSVVRFISFCREYRNKVLKREGLER